MNFLFQNNLFKSDLISHLNFVGYAGLKGEAGEVIGPMENPAGVPGFKGDRGDGGWFNDLKV